MPWRIVIEPQDGREPTVVGVHRRLEAALRVAEVIALRLRAAGPNRPKVHVVQNESSDQLQTYAHGTKAVRDQPHLPARGQDVVIVVPPAIAVAQTRPLGGR